MNDAGVCRTAPATPGLLNKLTSDFVWLPDMLIGPQCKWHLLSNAVVPTLLHFYALIPMNYCGCIGSEDVLNLHHSALTVFPTSGLCAL